MKTISSPTSHKKPRISKLSPDWQKLAQAELSLRADEQAVLRLKDKALYYILTPPSKLPVSKHVHIRDYRTKLANEHTCAMLEGLGFSFAGWNDEGHRAYERLLGKHKLRVEWGYWETKDGVVRHFKYLGPRVKERNMKREFLLMIVKLRREKQA